jgi:hypothetical protein
MKVVYLVWVFQDLTLKDTYKWRSFRISYSHNMNAINDKELKSNTVAGLWWHDIYAELQKLG